MIGIAFVITALANPLAKQTADLSIENQNTSLAAVKKIRV
jgi:hypothetical protein